MKKKEDIFADTLIINEGESVEVNQEKITPSKPKQPPRPEPATKIQTPITIPHTPGKK